MQGRYETYCEIKATLGIKMLHDHFSVKMIKLSSGNVRCQNMSGVLMTNLLFLFFSITMIWMWVIAPH